MQSDSKWNVYGKALTVLGLKFLDMFSTKIKTNYILLLMDVVDSKIEINPTKGRILFSSTLRQRERLLLSSSRNTAIKQFNELIDMGLIRERFVSETKGVPSEYYIVCPATVVMQKLGLNKKTTKVSRNDTETEINEGNIWE